MIVIVVIVIVDRSLVLVLECWIIAHVMLCMNEYIWQADKFLRIDSSFDYVTYEASQKAAPGAKKAKLATSSDA